MQSVRLFLSSLVGSCSAKLRDSKTWLVALAVTLSFPLQAQEAVSIRFTAPTYFAAEQEGNAIITITRLGDQGPVAVDLVVAEAGTTNTLVFSNFQMSATFLLQV